MNAVFDEVKPRWNDEGDVTTKQSTPTNVCHRYHYDIPEVVALRQAWLIVEWVTPITDGKRGQVLVDK